LSQAFCFLLGSDSSLLCFFSLDTQSFSFFLGGLEFLLPLFFLEPQPFSFLFSGNPRCLRFCFLLADSLSLLFSSDPIRFSLFGRNSGCLSFIRLPLGFFLSGYSFSLCLLMLDAQSLSFVRLPLGFFLRLDSKSLGFISFCCQMILNNDNLGSHGSLLDNNVLIYLG
jgi:hypothetical protein